MRVFMLTLLSCLIISGAAHAGNLNDKAFDSYKKGMWQGQMVDLWQLCDIEKDLSITVGTEAAKVDPVSGKPGTNQIQCAVTLRDSDGDQIDEDMLVHWWLATADKTSVASGLMAAETATAPDIDLTISDGISVKEITTNVSGYAATGVDGDLVITVGDDDADTDWYLCIAADAQAGTSLTISHV